MDGRMTGIVRGEVVPGLKRHLRNALNTDASNPLFPVLSRSRARLTRPVFGWTSTIMIPRFTTPAPTRLFGWFEPTGSTWKLCGGDEGGLASAVQASAGINRS